MSRKKKKKKKKSIGRKARKLAREVIGPIPPTRKMPNRKIYKRQKEKRRRS